MVGGAVVGAAVVGGAVVVGGVVVGVVVVGGVVVVVTKGAGIRSVATTGWVCTTTWWFPAALPVLVQPAVTAMPSTSAVADMTAMR